MWKKTSSYALFCAALLASVVAQNAATSSVGAAAARDVLITMPVQVDGSFKDLQLMRGETIEDAAVGFARDHGLLANSDATRVRAVVDQLSGMLRGRVAEMQATEKSAVAPTPKTAVQLSMPLTINGATRELKKFEGESVEAAAERFLYEGEFSMNAMRELYPQIVDRVLAKLEQLQPARKELFSFTLTIDGKQATARHFENGDPMEEARETFRAIDVTNEAYIADLAPQIAIEINRRIAAMQTPQQPPAQPPAPTKELFSIPLTVNERPTVLVHYEGFTSRESAMRYLNENGLAGADTVDSMMGQLIPIIDNRIAEIAQEQAAKEAAARVEAEARARAEAEAAAAAQASAQEAVRAAAARQPLVSLPINIGNDRSATLEYFRGDSIERTVEVFLTQIGMQEGPMFTQNAAQLSEAVRRQLQNVHQDDQTAAAPVNQQQPPAEEARPTPAEPYVQLPVTLGGRVFDLLYFEGEQPATTANTFCVEKYEIIRSELGMQFDGEQLLECKNLLEKTLHNLIAEKQQAQAMPTETTTQTQAPPQPAKPRARGEHLVSLDIVVDGRNVPFDVYQNDDPEEVARAFCDTHKIGHENIPPLVQAINEQKAQLK